MSEPSASDSQMDEVVPHSNGAADTESSSEAEDLSTVKQHQPAADAQPSDRLPDSPDAAVHQQNGGNRDAPLTPEALHENGNGVSADVEEGSAEGSSPAEPAAEAPWTKRLYFVRMPKPQEDNQYAVKVLQEEIDVYKNQVQLLNESLNVVKVGRLQCQYATSFPASAAFRLLHELSHLQTPPALQLRHLCICADAKGQHKKQCPGGQGQLQCCK